MYQNKVDTDWVRQSFMLPRGAVDARDQVRRTYSEVSRKFVDTTLGGNYAINPPPQFTSYADPKQARVSTVSKGMGRRYSELIDDNSQLVNLRFGTTEYNSLTTFFTSFYDPELAMMTRTGRSSGMAYAFGKVIGYVMGIPLALPILTGKALRFFMNWPSSKFCYLKPGMPLYWNAVNSLLNELAVNLGIIAPLVQTNYDETKNAVFADQKLTQARAEQFNKIIPDVFRGDGGIDIYAVATRAHRLARAWKAKMAAAYEEGGSLDDIVRRIEAIEREPIVAGPRRSLNEYMRSYMDTSAASSTPEPTQITTIGPDGVPVQKTDPIGAPELAGSFYPKEEGAFTRASKYLQSEWEDGSQFVCFRVDHAGPSTASFSSSVQESDLASTINSTSSASRNKRFSLADGNIGDGPIASTIEGFLGGAKDVLNGVADSVGMSGLAVMAGAAFADIPKHYANSSTQFPRAEFTIQLRSAYGNDASRLMALYTPLAMLLAGALPRSTGKASYDSPFHCECYSRGYCQIRYGMIDQLTVTAGTGNLGFNKDRKPLGIDITFSVVDMSSIMHMPLVPGASPGDLFSLKNATAKIFAEDSAAKDYLAVLSSMTLSSQVYQLPKLFRNITKASADINSWFTASRMANAIGGMLPSRIWSSVILGTDRL